MTIAVGCLWLCSLLEFEAQRQTARAVHKPAVGEAHLAVEADALQARQQFLEQAFEFEAREMLADADMRPIAESELLVRLAVEAKFERIVEHRLVTVPRGIAEHQPVALGDPAAGELRVFGRRAHEGLDRGRPSDRFFDESGDERRVGLEPLQQRGIAREDAHAAGERR